MRLLHVDAETGWSGGEVQVFLLMEGLRARGHDQALAAPAGSAAAQAARRRGFEVLEVAQRGDLDLGSVRRLARALRSGGYEVAHLHTGRSSWLGGLAALRAGVPALSTRRMDRRVKRSWKNRLLYGRLLAHTAAISPAVERLLHDAGVDPARTSVVWDAVDPEGLRPAGGEAAARARVRAELGIDPDAPLVLHCARAVTRKGQHVLIEAAARLPEDARVVLAGDGERLEDLRAQVHAAGLQGRVHLLGARDDVPDLLAACDLYAMPSLQEGLGVAALEAMAVGRAVVASAVGGLGEVVVDGVTGRLVPPGEPGPLADALAELLRDPGLRARYSSAAVERVRELFLPAAMVDAYERLYARLRAAPPRRPPR